METCADFLADEPAPTPTTNTTADRPMLFRVDDTSECHQSLTNVETQRALMQARMEILQNFPFDAQETTKKVPNQDSANPSVGPTLRKELQIPSSDNLRPLLYLVRFRLRWLLFVIR